ncbi:carbohydrate ABC transporter permease [Jiangella alba]|uniref:Multiple sugar transport system permease protein n=1 Tax=Jiangella alba TaxID=561176 RepID=A0A1H5JZU4_9ACTN|nr:sugar ABC transporter permease [Jiangella alba]SEE58022.1 multiple sugar transport system permease protein [Jiangella alba]
MTATTEAPARAASPPGRSARRRHGDGWWPWLFVLPTMAGVAVFYLWPIVQTGYYSFTEWGVFGGTTWVGGENYARLLDDPDLPRALLNTLVYTAVVLCCIPIAMVVASLLNRPGLRFASFYRVLYFMPYVAMPTAVAMVWRIIYNGDFGVLNWALDLVGIEGRHWTSTPGFAIGAVAVVGLWTSLGFAIIILSAGLRTIPAELYEAAALDGAGSWRQFRSITVPLLTPSIFFVMVILIINGFQLFDLLYAIMGSRNPALPDTQSLVFLFYNEAFIGNDKGFAAAIAMVILVVVGAVTLLQFRMQRRWVRYV